MKNLLILLLSFFCLSASDISPDISGFEVYYRVELDNKNDDNKFRSTVSLVKERIDNLRLILEYSDQKAVFKVKGNLHAFQKDDFVHKTAISVLNLNGKFYADLQKEELIRLRKYNDLNYCITSKIKEREWLLQEEKKEIAGYTCKKAISSTKFTDRFGKISDLKITAWYTDEIPISLGPKNYAGLPGLILELSEGVNRITYHFESITLNKHILIEDINYSSVDKFVSEVEYFDLVNK